MHLRHIALGLAAALGVASAPLAAQQPTGDAAMALLPHFVDGAGADGNLIYSPVSVNQIAAIADLESKGQSLQGAFKPALPAAALNSNDHAVTVRVGNALWLARSVKLGEEAEALATRYGTVTQQADFRRRDRLAGRINQWVTRSTDGQIASVIVPREIDPTDRSLVTGVAFFDGEWATPLKGRTTATFTTGSGAQRSAAFLEGSVAATVASTGGWTALRMAYTNPRYAMDVIVPAAGARSAVIPDGATIAAIGSALSSAPSGPVAVRLPEFEVGYETGLINALAAIGVEWPGLQARKQVRSTVSPDRKRFGIDAVKLAARLQLFDHGTSSEGPAGPSSPADIARTSPAKAQFAADRPFLLLIRDREQDAILFVARIADPTARPR